MAKSISQIAEFGFAAWEFITIIYKSKWNKLIANDKICLLGNMFYPNSIGNPQNLY